MVFYFYIFIGGTSVVLAGIQTASETNSVDKSVAIKGGRWKTAPGALTSLDDRTFVCRELQQHSVKLAKNERRNPPRHSKELVKLFFFRIQWHTLRTGWGGDYGVRNRWWQSCSDPPPMVRNSNSSGMFSTHPRIIDLIFFFFEHTCVDYW